MSKSKSPNKYAADISLFKPEPPTDEKLVKALFAGREAQLERGYQTLLNQCDVEGKRSRSFDKRPWVIHGESRSGKSHLARRILAEFRANPKRLRLLVPARERIEAILVMADLFRQMLGHFRRLTQDQRLPQTVADLPDVRLVDQLIERMQMFLNEAQSATLSREQGAETTLEVGANYRPCSPSSWVNTRPRKFPRKPVKSSSNPLRRKHWPRCAASWSRLSFSTS